MTDQEKIMLGRLSVFAGSWTLSAAEAVCGENAWEDLSALVNTGWVQIEAESDRFFLVEPVRGEARQALAESGEAATIRRRHRDFFLALAEAVETHLTEAHSTAWLERLDVEQDNFREALSWSVQQDSNAEAGLRLAAALRPFWALRNQWSEGQAWLAQVLAKSESVSGLSGPKAKALLAAGILASLLDEWEAAESFCEQSLALYETLADTQGIAQCLNRLGDCVVERGNHSQAHALYTQSLGLFREIGDQNGICTALRDLGYTAYDQGDYDAARALLEESLALARVIGYGPNIAGALKLLGRISLEQGDYAAAWSRFDDCLEAFRKSGNPSRVAGALGEMGNTAQMQGDLAKAERLLEESLAIFRSLGQPGGAAASLSALGSVALDRGDVEAARTYLLDSLRLLRSTDDKRNLGAALDALGRVALAQRQIERSVRLRGAAEALQESLGVLPTLSDPEAMGRYQAEVSQEISKEGFAAAWEDGQAMTPEQATEYALNFTAGHIDNPSALML